MKQTLLGAALAALLAAGAVQTAAAQQTAGPRPRNQALVEAAVESYGFDPARLAPAQQRALDEAWALLLPGESSRTYRLNRTQALALAYVALVLREQPRGGRGDGGRGPGGGRGDDGWGGGRGDGWGGGAGVAEAERALFDLAAAIPSSIAGNGIFLSPEEKERVRRDALRVGRLALDGECSPLADEASRLASSVAGQAMVDRRTVAAQIERMQRTAEGCR